MTLAQLKYFIKTVECGGITKAANQLFISQPSLSAAIRELEAEFHTELFVRGPKGIALSSEGAEFLSYARQITEQAELLEQRYTDKRPSKRICSISTQHYSFAVSAFVKLVSSLDADEYELTLRETRTHEIIEDVRSFRSELGIIYISDFNEKVITKLLKENHLTFFPLFEAAPHVFLCSAHPLAEKTFVTPEELENYPFLTFDQGEHNSFYCAEEPMAALPRKKTIRVSDRATLFNLLIGLDGYTVCTGIISRDLNGENIISVPLKTKEIMRVGYILNEKAAVGLAAKKYIEELKKEIPRNKPGE